MLNNLGNAPRGIDNRVWRLMERTQAYLLGLNPLFLREINHGEYGLGARRLQLITRPALVEMGDSAQISQMEGYFNFGALEQILLEYQNIFWGARDRNDTTQSRKACKTLATKLRLYAHSFCAFYEGIVSPLLTLTALHPSIFYDLIDPGQRWRDGYCLYDDEDFLNEHNLRNAAYRHKIRGFMAEQVGIGPMLPGEGLSLFFTGYAPSGAYRGGVKVDSEVNINIYNDLFNSNDGDSMINEYTNLLLSGQQLMESLELVSELSLGDILPEGLIRNFLLRAIRTSVFDISTARRLLKALDVNISPFFTNAHVSQKLRNGRIDFRIYCPRLGILNDAEEIVDEIEPLSFIRDSVRQNFLMLYNYFFGPRGFIKFGIGATFSRRLMPVVNFESVHDLGTIFVLIHNDMTVYRSFVLGKDHYRYKVTYYGVVRNLDGRHEIGGELIIETPGEIIDQLNNRLPYTIENRYIYLQQQRCFIKSTRPYQYY